MRKKAKGGTNMFKPRKQTNHCKPHSHNHPHPSQNESFHQHAAGQHPYEHGFHEHEGHPFNAGKHGQDFHEHEACQNCPYKRSFYEHFHHEHNGEGFHGHHHGSHHSHSEHSEEAKRLEDGSLQCLGCPNECIMTVSEEGSVSGNHCPKGAEAARHIAE